jgi:hypothetical protein
MLYASQPCHCSKDNEIQLDADEGSFISYHITYINRDSSVGVETKLRAGRTRFNSRQGMGIFFLATASVPALGPSQPPIQLVPWFLL